MIIKEAFVAFGVALSIMIPIKLVVLKNYENGEMAKLDFGSENKEQLGNSLM